jgi:hypothetical protein
MQRKIRYIFLFLIPYFANGGEIKLDSGKINYSGEMGVELRQFINSPSITMQDMSVVSGYAEPEMQYKSKNDKHSFDSKLFYRLDGADNDRTHFDIREMMFKKTFSDKWQAGIGIGNVFWGVTEARHLVNIINQDDTVEGLLSDAKLGQPMANVNYYGDKIGSVELYVLPYFREKTFPGREGRLRVVPGVDTHQDAIYESSKKERHVDFAGRVMKRFSGLDLGISHFYGTSREPLYQIGRNSYNEVAQIPVYNIINQTGLEAQYAHENTLYKLESFFRSGQEDDFIALDGGFEHSFVGVMGSNKDISLLAEYLYESRESTYANNKLAFNPYTNDIMAGARLNFNDEQSTEALMALTFDLHSSAKIFTFEASRRIGNDWKISSEAVAFISIPNTNPTYSMRHDSVIQLELSRHF